MTVASPPPVSAWTSRRILFLGVIGAILAASITAGVRLMNARVDARDVDARDAKRMADLQAIVAAAQELYETEREIPASLAEIEKKTKGRLSVADPETFEVYEYRVIGPKLFEVCARFDEKSSGGPDEHGVGRSCFRVGME